MIPACSKYNATGKDPYFSSVVSLLHFNGTNGSTTFTDQKGVTWTRGGTPTISTAQSKFGGASGVFNGSTDYLYTETSANFSFSSSDFTVEGYFNLNSVSSQPYLFHFYVPSGQRWAVQVDASNAVLFFNSGGSGVYSTTGIVSTGQFVHVAVTKSGSTTRVFVGGIKVLTTTTAVYQDANHQIILGSAQFTASSNYLDGYVDDFRVTKGVCRYVDDFIPPQRQFADA